MYCTPAACGKLYIDSASLVQQHFIIAGRSLLVDMGERGRAIRTRVNEYVAPIVATRAAEVGVGKAIDEAVTVMIAASAVPVPRIGTRVRA